MDLWLIELYNSFDDKNKDSVLTLFISISISLFTYAVPAVYGKSDIVKGSFVLARLTNDAFPRAIVGGVSFYVALIFLIRDSATSSLFRGMFILIFITIGCWLASLYFTARNQSVIEKKELEHVKNKEKKLVTEYSVWRMMKWNLLIIFIWFGLSIGLCLSKPLSDALTKKNTISLQTILPSN